MLQKCKKCGVAPNQDAFPCDPAGSAHEYVDPSQEAEILKWKVFDQVFLTAVNEYLQIFLIEGKTPEERQEMLMKKLFEIVQYIHSNTELKFK